jgi:type IV pilus assembly protein PilW
MKPIKAMTTSARRPHTAKQAGLTLLELLVAMTLGLLIVLAAAAALLVSRQGFFAVDAASQLRDNARYAQSIVQRVGVQAGFKNINMLVPPPPEDPANPFEPSVFGINNAKRSTSTAWDAGSTWGTSDAGKNSDILVLRAHVSTTTGEVGSPSDGSMIDCLGEAPPVTSELDGGFFNILHVQASSAGEPALMCTRAAAGGGFEAQPLVQGVESFQVLYGVDNVVPNTAPTGATDSVPDRYLRADQLTVTGNDAATYANWRRVRSLRIGMVLRSQPGSAVDTASQTFYPLGTSRSSASGAIGSAFAHATNDPGTVFTPPVDRRLRQVVTFTVHLRNFQDLEPS